MLIRRNSWDPGTWPGHFLTLANEAGRPLVSLAEVRCERRDLLGDNDLCNDLKHLEERWISGHRTWPIVGVIADPNGYFMIYD